MQYDIITYCLNNPVMGFDPDGYYNRDKAVKYANKWYSGYNRNSYPFFKYDCTNFVSQCLRAGGIKFDNVWYCRFKATFYTNRNWTYSKEWINAKAQYKYFSNANKSFYKKNVRKVISISPHSNDKEYKGRIRDAIKKNGIQEGDLIYFSNKKSGVHHAVFIINVTKTDIRYAGHTNHVRKWLTNIKSKDRETIFIVLMKG